MSDDPVSDRRWLDAATRLATPYLGTTGSGPTVAALIVDEQRQLTFGRAVTPAGGHGNAEILALEEARELAKGRTLFMTLEPSARFGAGRPTTGDIARSGIARIVVGMLDPDPAHSGAGLKDLKGRGLDTLHFPHQPSIDLNEGYSARIAKKRPHVTMKLTLTADGMVGHATAGEPPLIGPEARRWLERQRAASDAILSGAARGFLENTSLMVHLRGLHTQSHQRVILAGAGPLETGFDLFTGVSGYPTMVIADEEKPLTLRPGIELVRVEGKRGRPNLRPALNLLASRGINRVLVEAGAQLAESLISAELVDRLFIVDVPMRLGKSGIPAAVLGRFEDRVAAARFSEVDRRALGEDKVRTFERH